jgi:N6-adenosine-specific RNA methylase IME4
MANNRTKKDPRDIVLAGCTLSVTGIQFDKSVNYDEWVGIGEFLDRAEGAVQWWIGDWLNYGEGRPQWGDKYEQAISLFNREYKTLSKYKAVSNAIPFPLRRGNLSFTHHEVLAYEPPVVRKKLLAEAEPDAPDLRPKMSVSELKKEAKRIRREAGTPPLPEGTYRVLYADPSWEYADEREGTSAGGSAAAQYDLIPTECICALHQNGRSIRDVAAKDSVLFLWATAPMLPDAMQVVSAWGFKYGTHFMWDKKRQYVESYNLVRHELLLIAAKGSCTPEEGSLRDSVVQIERTTHSKKPDEFYEIIESMYPDGPYLELFARKVRKGWTAWGNEIHENEQILPITELAATA